MTRCQRQPFPLRYTVQGIISLASPWILQGNQGMVSGRCSAACWTAGPRDLSEGQSAPRGPSPQPSVDPTPSCHSGRFAASCVQDSESLTTCWVLGLSLLPESEACSLCLPSRLRGDLLWGTLSVLSTVRSKPVFATSWLGASGQPSDLSEPHPMVRNSSRVPRPLPPTATANSQELTRRRQFQNPQEDGEESKIIIAHIYLHLTFQRTSTISP